MSNYERFTDRARKVMQLANQEAQRLSHEYVGTEHILLGIAKEGSGVAANVLQNIDIGFAKIRLEVEKLVQAGPQPTTGKLPLTPRADTVIKYAVDESRKLGHTYLGTEHLLLGLLREQEGVAAQVLMNLSVRLDSVREQVVALVDKDKRTKRIEVVHSVCEKGEEHDSTLVRLLNQAKEEAVAEQQFPLAATLREMIEDYKATDNQVRADSLKTISECHFPHLDTRTLTHIAGLVKRADNGISE